MKAFLSGRLKGACLLCSPVNGIVMAIPAGWKGATTGLIRLHGAVKFSLPPPWCVWRVRDLFTLGRGKCHVAPPMGSPHIHLIGTKKWLGMVKKHSYRIRIYGSNSYVTLNLLVWGVFYSCHASGAVTCALEVFYEFYFLFIFWFYLKTLSRHWGWGWWRFGPNLQPPPTPPPPAETPNRQVQNFSHTRVTTRIK